MRLLVLCPCERVIFDKRETPSLISLIQNMDVAFELTAEGQKIDPKKIVFPKEWVLYSRWESSGEDVGKIFEQTWQIHWPDGEKFAEHKMMLKPVTQGDNINQSYVQLSGLPGQPGVIKISTWLSHESQQVSEVFIVHVTLRHIPFPEGMTVVPAP
jgi:hypothetical protein